MKHTFKISVLALVVGLGLTACKPNSSASTPNLDTNKKTPITKPAEPTKPTTPAKPTEPTKPTTPVKPTEPAKPTEPTKPTTPNSGFRPITDVSKLDNSWRTVNFYNELTDPNAKLKVAFESNTRRNDWNDIDIDLNKLNNGLFTLGLNKGSIKGLEMYNGNLTQMDYLIVNQPYSSYGAFFDGSRETSANTLFRLYSGGFGGFTNANQEYKAESGTVGWSDKAPQGKVTYRGDVIAKITDIGLYDSGYTYNNIRTPVVDGTVSLSLEFDKNDVTNTQLSGKIESKALGTITIEKQKTYPNPVIETLFKARAEGFIDNGTGVVQFSGKDNHDMTGTLNLSRPINQNRKVGDIIRYDAVFGGTRQQ